MSKAKIICLTVITLIFFSVQPATAVERGQKAFGVRTGYVSDNNSVDAGLFFQYTFSKHFRLEPSADIIFRNKNRDAFMINLDAHIPFGFSNSKFDLYPLAGLNYSSWNRHTKLVDNESHIDNDVSTRKSRFGVNFGAGFDLKVSETLKINLQAEYTLIKTYSTLRAMVGIAYVF